MKVAQAAIEGATNLVLADVDNTILEKTARGIVAWLMTALWPNGLERRKVADGKLQ